MSTGRILAILLVLLAGVGPAAAGSRLQKPDAAFSDAFTPHRAVRALSSGAIRNDHEFKARDRNRSVQQSDKQVIPPSMALRQALRYSPGSQGLDVTLVKGGRLMYAVKLKAGNRIVRVLVDAQTGRVLGE